MIHPIIAYRSRFYIWWLIWLLIGAGQSLLLVFITDLGVFASFTDGLVSAILYSLLAISLWFPIRQLSQIKNKLLVTLGNHMLFAALSIILWIVGVKLITGSLVRDSIAYLEFWDISFHYRLAGGIFIYIVVVLTYYLMISIDNINKKNIKEAQLENMLRETELMMLRSQINPHFLFNSLNSVSSLTITSPDKAREMVIKLSEFMRYALSRKEDRVVSLEKELLHMRLYMDIEKVRFGDRLVLEEEVDDSCLGVGVPNMILQPLYENAVKHGVYESVDRVLISVRVECAEGGTLIKITNDYDPDSVPAKGTGTGLNNVLRRLDLYYTKKAWLHTRKENGKFTAEMYIPAKKT